MFLYYVVARDLENVEKLLASSKVQDQLSVRYDRTTISVLDLYVAQLQHESLKPGDSPKILVDVNGLEAWFQSFETWFNTIKKAKVPRIATNSSTTISLFIAAASQVWVTPDKVTEEQWELIQIFPTQGPSKIEDAIGLPTRSQKESGQDKKLKLKKL